MSQEKDKVFFRNFSLVVGLLAVLMIVFMIAARIVGIDEEAEAERRAAAVAKATAPMGESQIAGEEAAAPAAVTATPDASAPEIAEGGDAGSMGKKVFDGLCVSCHGLGPAMAAMIPQLGDKAAWEPRIAKGKDTLYQNAINGFTGSGGMMMPPRGGGDLSDEEVQAAVDYMVENSM